MIKAITRCSAPFYVQFELTERCNHRCFFCYNEIGGITGAELSLDEVTGILSELGAAQVFRVNFNGGEPLLREDFVAIAQHARNVGLDVHMNTNATLVDDEIAGQLAPLVSSVCVSLLAGTPEHHDSMSGRDGAFAEVLAGIDTLRRANIPVEVNVCTTLKNYQEIYSIAQLAASHGCYAICSTRYILTDALQKHLLMTSDATCELIAELIRIRDEIPEITDVSLPGPVPLCEIPSEMHEELAALNVPCQFGYGLCRISATGIVTPCTISQDEIADLRKVSFKEAWQAKGWDRYSELDHIPTRCRDCEEFARCRAGCIVYDEGLIQAGLKPDTLKWRE